VNHPVNIRKAKKAVKKCFTVQIEREKFALVEILSPCPTAWRLSPLDSLKWMEEKMIPYFPLGVIKDLTGSGKDLQKPARKKLPY